MVPAQAGVRRAVALRVTEQADASRHEPVEPPVLHLAVEADPARVAGAGPAAAPPVERELRVHVIADREVVAEVLHVATISRAIAEQLAQLKTRRQNSAAAARPDV